MNDRNYVGLSVALVCGSLALALFPRWVVEDAAILFRYAEVFHRTGQLFWNAGEQSQAYTGILLLLALVISPLPYITTAHLVGGAAYLLGVVSIYLMFRDKYTRWVILAVFISSPAILIQVYSGLETMLYMSLMLLSGLAFVRKRPWLLLASLTLVSLARPEGILFSVVMLYLYKDRRLAFWWVAMIGVYMLWTYSYYGSLLPNSFYYKSIAENEFQKNLAEFLPTLIFTFSVPLVVFALTFDPRRWKVQVPLAILFAAIVAYYLECHLVVDFSGRFFIQTLPILIVTLAIATIRLPKELAYGLIALQLVLSALDLPRNLEEVRRQRASVGMFRETAEFIKANYPASSRLALCFDAGFVPYLTMMPSLDMEGLMDRDIADYSYTHKTSNDPYLGMVQTIDIFRYKINRCFSFNPQIIVIASGDMTFPQSAFYRLFTGDRRFQKYRFAKRITADHPTYRYSEFVFTVTPQQAQ